MSFLRINKLLRHITTQRSVDKFPLLANDIEIMEESDTKRTIFVLNNSISKSILLSDSGEEYNFLSRAMTVYGIHEFPILSRLTSTLPIFLDSESHFITRKKYIELITRYSPVSTQLFQDKLKCLFRDFECKDYVDVTYWASLLSSAAIEALFKPIIPSDLDFCFEPTELDLVDFFNPFPTKAALKNTENMLQKYDSLINLGSSSEGILCMSMLTMGYMPLKALFASLLNDFISNGFKLSGLTAYNVLPTNFVIRQLSSDFDLNFTSLKMKEHSFSFRTGDIVYVFLADGGGCPFNVKTSMPWGFGKHACPGKRISEKFLKLLSYELQLQFKTNPTWARKQFNYATIASNKSTAFLLYD
jgi:hypothetical protein